MNPSAEQILPWYRQFWFWFVFGPLIFIIGLCVFTVSLAFRYADDVVTDNYYKDGVMINQVLQQDERAIALNLKAELKFDSTLGELLVSITNGRDLPPQLTLYMDHPVKKTMDQHILLQQIAPGHYRADLSSAPEFSWYLVLVPGTDRKKADWSLSGDINFAKASQAVLQPRVQ